MSSTEPTDPPYIAYLVHGTYSSAGAWPSNSLLLTQFKEIGAEIRVVRWTGNNSHVDRVCCACLLAQRIQEEWSTRKHAQVVVVGHSHGGTISHYAAARLPLEIRRDILLVTLGSPIIRSEAFPKNVVLASWRRGVFCFLRSLDLLLWMYLYTAIGHALYAWASAAAGWPWMFRITCCAIAFLVWLKGAVKRCLEMWLFDATLRRDTWLATDPRGISERLVIREGPPPNNPDEYAYGSSVVSHVCRSILRTVSRYYDRRHTKDVGLSTDAPVLSVFSLGDEAILGLKLSKGVQWSLLSLTKVANSVCDKLFTFITRTCFGFVFCFLLSQAGWLPEPFALVMHIMALAFVAALFIVPIAVGVAVVASLIARLLSFTPYGIPLGKSGLLWGNVSVDVQRPTYESFRVPFWYVIKRRSWLVHCDYYNLPCVVEAVIGFVRRVRKGA